MGIPKIADTSCNANIDTSEENCYSYLVAVETSASHYVCSKAVAVIDNRNITRSTVLEQEIGVHEDQCAHRILTTEPSG